ncbi:hypothetical protein GN244_ATG11723 [Phytophthora infestans]|nr:hypothetical protein GN244_ATG11723 [Phytophthora infestans]
MNHLRAHRPDYKQVGQSLMVNTLVIFACSDKAKTGFGRLQWIVDGEMPLNFCENALAQKYTRLQSLAKTTLMTFLRALTVLGRG